MLKSIITDYFLLLQEATSNKIYYKVSTFLPEYFSHYFMIGGSHVRSLAAFGNCIRTSEDEKVPLEIHIMKFRNTKIPSRRHLLRSSASWVIVQAEATSFAQVFQSDRN